MADQTLRTELADLVSRIEQDAYRRGWEDAISHVVSAASKAAEPIRAAEGTQQRPQKQKASYGAVPVLTELMLTEAGDRGVIPHDVVVYGQSQGEDVAESSVRRILGRMVHEGIAKKERGRWFLVQGSRTDAGQESEGADTPSDDSTHQLSRGYHAAA